MSSYYYVNMVLNVHRNHKAYQGRGEGEERYEGRLYTYRYYCHHQNDSCIKMGGDESNFSVSLNVRDKVTRQCPQTTTFLKRKENRSGIEPRSFCLLMSKCCFTSTETVGLLGTGSPGRPPRLSHKFLSSVDDVVVWLECYFTSTETVGLLGTGAQHGHLDFHTDHEFCPSAYQPNALPLVKPYRPHYYVSK